MCGWFEGREDLAFVAKAPDHQLRVHPAADHLERDVVLELVVGAAGEIDRAHAAAPETLFDRVPGLAGGRYAGRPRRRAARRQAPRRPRRPRRRARARLGSRKKRQWEPPPPTATRPPPGAPDRRHTACPAARNAVRRAAPATRASTSLTRTQDGMVVPNHTAGQQGRGPRSLWICRAGHRQNVLIPAQRLHDVDAGRARGGHQRGEDRRPRQAASRRPGSAPGRERGHPGCSCRRPAPAASPPTTPAAMPTAAMTAPSRSTRASRWRGAEPIASRMPNSRVRALTENASTPATPTTAIEQRDAGEAAEHQRVQPVRRQHFGADVFQRRRLLDRLVGREIADDARDRRHQRVRIGPRVHEQAAAADLLLERVVDGHRRSRHHVLVVHVGGDADDAARRRC